MTAGTRNACAQLHSRIICSHATNPTMGAGKESEQAGSLPPLLVLSPGTQRTSICSRDLSTKQQSPRLRRRPRQTRPLNACVKPVRGYSTQSVSEMRVAESHQNFPSSKQSFELLTLQHLLNAVSYCAHACSHSVGELRSMTRSGSELLPFDEGATSSCSCSTDSQLSSDDIA